MKLPCCPTLALQHPLLLPVCSTRTQSTHSLPFWKPTGRKSWQLGRAYSHCLELQAGTGSGDHDASGNSECHTTPVDGRRYTRSLTAQGPHPMYPLWPPPSFPTTPFLNSPPLGQADRPAHHEPQSLIQGEPATHPLKHTRINSKLRRSVPRRPNAPPASLPPPSLCIQTGLPQCLLLSPKPAHHQMSSPFLTKQELIIYTEGGHILRILHPQGPRKEARQERKTLAVLADVKDTPLGTGDENSTGVRPRHLHPDSLGGLQPSALQPHLARHLTS